MYPLDGQKTDVAVLNKVSLAMACRTSRSAHRPQALAEKDGQISMLKRKVEEATGDLIKQTDALDRMRSDFSGR